MRVLLDECLPRELATELPGHEVWTVPQAGWASIKNGALLRLAVTRFDVFVTIDQGGHLFLGREAAVREAAAGFLGRQLQPKQAVRVEGG